MAILSLLDYFIRCFSFSLSLCVCLNRAKGGQDRAGVINDEPPEEQSLAFPIHHKKEKYMHQRTTALPSVDGGGSQYSMGCRSGSAIKGRRRGSWRLMTWWL